MLALQLVILMSTGFRADVGLGLQLVYYFRFREYRFIMNQWSSFVGYVPLKYKIQLSYFNIKNIFMEYINS